MPQESSNLWGREYCAYMPVMAAVMPLRPEGGAQAQHIVVPAGSVVPMPEGVSLGQASIPMQLSELAEPSDVAEYEMLEAGNPKKLL
jgi:hypothetical protein